MLLLKSVLIATLGTTIAINSTAQSGSQLIFDKQQSQHVGSHNLITLHKALYSFEDKYIPDTLNKENTFFKKTGGIIYRASKILLLDAQIDGIIALAQHEVFGHGARFREFGFERNSFNLNLYPPFGNGSGFASYGILNKKYKHPTAQENIAITIGGVGGEFLLADILTSHMLLNDMLHYRQGLLYLIAQNNLFLYLWHTRLSKPKNITSGNDMVNYINKINNLYIHPTNKDYDIEKLSIQSLISFANPLQCYSAFAILYTYGIKGKKQLNKIPMIKFGRLRYLPAINYSLTPFGSQYHFINYFRYKHMLFSADINVGENTFNTFFGASVKGYNLIERKKVGLNFHVDIWNQPELELDKYSTPNSAKIIGQSFKIDLTLRPFYKYNQLALFIQTGYKSKGHLIGEPLAESFILRYGLSFHL